MTHNMPVFLQYLQRAAGLARSIMEQGLEQVAIADGIALPVR